LEKKCGRRTFGEEIFEKGLGFCNLILNLEYEERRFDAPAVGMRR